MCTIVRLDSILEDISNMKADGMFVKINYNIPTVEVFRSDESKWFFQGQEATDLVADAEESPLKEDIEPEDLILWCSAGW